MNIELVVMAAGMGSRYGGLKQLDGVGPSGERLLDYSLYDALRAGFSRVVFVIRRDFEEVFRSRVLPSIASRVEVACVCQEQDAVPRGIPVAPDRVKPWGTGQAILCCRDVVQGPFAVINADDFYGAEAFQRLAKFLHSSDPASPSFALVGYQIAQTLSKHGSVSRGICSVTSEGRLRGVEEWTDIRLSNGTIRARRSDEIRILSPETPVSMNLWGFTPALFPSLAAEFESFLWREGWNPKAEFFIPTVINDMLQQRRAEVWVLETGARWMGLTYADDREAVRRGIGALINEGAYPSSLWFSATTQADEEQSEATRPVHCAPDQS